jgi:cyanate lyase
MPPQDPLLYRFVEMIQVFGYPLKAVIHEKVYRHYDFFFFFFYV